jgi:hypothetical protein
VSGPRDRCCTTRPGVDNGRFNVRYSDTTKFSVLTPRDLSVRLKPSDGSALGIAHLPVLGVECRAIWPHSFPCEHRSVAYGEGPPNIPSRSLCNSRAISAACANKFIVASWSDFILAIFFSI